MSTTTITFSDSSTLILGLNDTVTPISLIKGESNHTSFEVARAVEWNIHNGSIPFLTTVFSTCEYFFINDKQNTVYNPKAIIKITVEE